MKTIDISWISWIQVDVLGDPSAGIFPTSVKIEMEKPLEMLTDDLNQIRGVLEKAFGELFGDDCRVSYDFEIFTELVQMVGADVARKEKSVSLSPHQLETYEAMQPGVWYYTLTNTSDLMKMVASGHIEAGANPTADYPAYRRPKLGHSAKFQKEIEKGEWREAKKSDFDAPPMTVVTDTPVPDNVELVWRTFWKELLSVNGILDLGKIKRELSDYQTAITEVSKVYTTLTNNKFSKPNTHAQVIIDEVVKQEQELAVSEMFNALFAIAKLTASPLSEPDYGKVYELAITAMTAHLGREPVLWETGADYE